MKLLFSKQLVLNIAHFSSKQLIVAKTKSLMLSSFTSSLSKSSSANFDNLTEELSKMNFAEEIEVSSEEKSEEKEKYVYWLKVFFWEEKSLREVYQQDGEIKLEILPHVADFSLERQIVKNFLNEVKLVIKVHEMAGLRNYPYVGSQILNDIAPEMIENNWGYSKIRDMLKEQNMKTTEARDIFIIQVLHICNLLFSKSKNMLLFTRLAHQNVKKMCNRNKKAKKLNNFQKFFEAIKFQNQNPDDFFNLQKMVKEILKLEAATEPVLTLKQIAFMVLCLMLGILMEAPISQVQGFYRFFDQFMFKKYLKFCDMPLDLNIFGIIEVESIQLKKIHSILDQIAEILNQDIFQHFQNLQLQKTPDSNLFYVFLLDSMTLLRKSVDMAIDWKANQENSKSNAVTNKKKNKRVQKGTCKFVSMYEELLDKNLEENLMVFQILKKMNKKERKRQRKNKMLEDEAMKKLLVEFKNTKIHKENRNECYESIILEKMAEWRILCEQELKNMK